MKYVFGLIILLSQLSAFADVAVVTYNMAQLKRNGIDLVACTRRRVSLQSDAIFKDPDSPIYADKNFVLLIQESWTKRSFKALRKAAEDKNLFFYPNDYQVVKNSGQIVISNLLSEEAKKIPFSHDKYAKKGMLYVRFDLGEGKTLGVINVHTGYSDRTHFSDEHRKHFEELGRTVEDLKPLTTHFVVGGDFNAGPDMGFKTVLYNAGETVWEKGIMPLMMNNGMRLLESAGITWDETNNALVRSPPILLRFVNLYKNGYAGWDMTDSTLDHIFVPRESEVTRHELAFNKKVKLNCGGRDGKDGLLHLSDHYGVMAVLKTE
jgi:endonuclease/exonuclease/phosphatase family metal-dependent hydrolase